MTIAYLGPEGTFSQQAAAILGAGSLLKPCNAIEDIFQAVYAGDCDGGVVPFENTTEGAVNETLDALLFGEQPVSIEALLPLPVSQCLMARDEYAGKPIAKILSHTQSLAQCRRYLRTRYPHAEALAVSSNGEAARRVAETDEPWAAVGPVNAAARYHLSVIEKNIQDIPNNTTVFIRISSRLQARPLRGRRTSLAFSTYNKPGELSRMLGIFDVYRVNMTKILSRPRRNAPGEYVFYVDIEDYIPRDASRALTLIKERSLFYKFLGSYPVTR